MLFEEEDVQWGLGGQSSRYLGFRSVSADNLLYDLQQVHFFSPHLLVSQFALPYSFKLEALRMEFGS